MMKKADVPKIGEPNLFYKAQLTSNTQVYETVAKSSCHTKYGPKKLRRSGISVAMICKQFKAPSGATYSG